MNESPWVKEALLYQKLEDKRLRCNTCERLCAIEPGKAGFCETRKDIDGKLYTLEYGNVSSLSANPIEKKPLFHFYPGSRALTIGSWSCNFRCPWCQNFDISKSPPDQTPANFISPEKFIDLMKEYRCQGTSISFNEPTLSLEYSLDIFELARKGGYYNTYVTNGYMTLPALRLLIGAGLGAMNLDLKGSANVVKKYCGADVEVVWRNAREAKESGVHIEITTLVIPGINDKKEDLKEIARRIHEELGADTPWHCSGYYPAYKFNAPPTPLHTLELARDIGKTQGLRYVYLGNAPGHKYENTYCPSCGKLLIERYIFDITRYEITTGKKCPQCGQPIPIVGKPTMNLKPLRRQPPFSSQKTPL